MTKYIITECSDITIIDKKLKNTIKKLIDKEISNIKESVTRQEDEQLAENTIKKLSNLKPYNKDGLKQFNAILDILSDWEWAYNPYCLEYEEI